MATVLLVRHGRSSANTAGVLAGRTPGVELDDTGRDQAAAMAARLAGVRPARVVTSPLERCRATASAIPGVEPVTEEGLTECDYGDWSGCTLKDLAGEGLWTVVQRQPSAAAFPGGESLAAMQARAVEAVRRHDREVEQAHGERAVWVAVTHGDLIKAVLADALGLHLDLFQRLHVDPASVSVVRYTPERPYVLTQNSSAGDLGWVVPPEEASKDAAVGGGAGPESGAAASGPTA